LVAIEAYLVLVALLVGSFINLAADRVPRGESLLRPRSHCRSCGRVLNAVDLLPVAGYLIRGGRCATCRVPIGGASPLIEAACGGCMAAALVWLGPWMGFALGATLIAVFGAAVVRLSVAKSRRAAEV
jgi:prepilin signal peptidase PulO-like enzyme (type II secretory pathway)